MPTLTWPSKSSIDKNIRGASQPDIPKDHDALLLDSLIFPQGEGYPDAAPAGRLILGDNLAVMSALLSAYEGSINLIYADPPFFTNRRYAVRVGRGEDSRRPQEWRLAEGYPDHWSDIDSYLNMLFPRLQLMHQLLASDGTLYLHLDWHASHYARLLLDEIFGSERFLNEIVWLYHGPSAIRKAFNRKHDTILVYTKSRSYTFNVEAVREPYHPSTVKTFESSPKAGFGKLPDLERGKVPEDWWYFPVVARLHNERTGYPTQKPEALLERIVLASSNPGDIIADFFCGSGTTAVVASRLGRRYIANDLSWRAIHITRSRLVSTTRSAFSVELEMNTAQDLIPINADTSRLCCTLDRSNRIISIDQVTLPEIDYWEVDPQWEGKVFRSAAQAIRPRSTRPIPARLGLSHLQPDLEILDPSLKAQLAIRMVGIDGSLTQFCIE